MSGLPPHPNFSHPSGPILRGPPLPPRDPTASKQPTAVFARPALPLPSSSSSSASSSSSLLLSASLPADLLSKGGGGHEEVPSNAFRALRSQQRGSAGVSTLSAAAASAARALTLDTKRGRFKALQFGSCDNPSDCSPVVFFIHGAGMSSMGFALCATTLNKMSLSSSDVDGGGGGGREVRGFAFDLRCHGESTFEGGEGSLTMECLVDDAIVVIQQAVATWYPSVRAVYIVGHSLGGAIVANMMAEKPDVLGFKVAAVAVLDVVEGTAKQSLQHMQGFLDRRPTSFTSEEAAVKWFLGAGGLKGEQSALLSVPTLVVKKTKEEGGRYQSQSHSGGASPPSHVYVWRTDLMKTLPLWSGWFEDLDKKFLAIPCPKMLLLAVTDRLDKELTIGHMMGKFQLEVVGASAHCGHYVMEDCPDIVAGKLLRLIRRMDTLYARLPIINHQVKCEKAAVKNGSPTSASVSSEANA